MIHLMRSLSLSVRICTHTDILPFLHQPLISPVIFLHSLFFLDITISSFTRAIKHICLVERLLFVSKWRQDLRPHMLGPLGRGQAPLLLLDSSEKDGQRAQVEGSHSTRQWIYKPSLIPDF